MTAPDGLAEQVRWLVDRASISDLLVDFARALDERDWDGYAANFTEDGEIAIGETIRHRGRASLAATVASTLEPYAATHHLSANHAIRIDGDEATTRSYLYAAHVPDAADPARHADGAGWYDCRLRRTGSGWRFTEVRLRIVYVSGEEIVHA